MPASNLHCELQRADRIRICAADADAVGLRGAYSRSSVELPDLQRRVTLGVGRRGGGYLVQAGWTPVMQELSLSVGMWVTLSIRGGRVRSIQKRAGPADPAPSMSAALHLVDSLSTEGHLLEQEQQPPQPAAPEVHSDALLTAGAVAGPTPELAQQQRSAAALPGAASHLGSMLFRVSGVTSARCLQKLVKRQAQAAFPGYSKQDSDVNVPALRRSFPVSMGWGGSDNRFMLGVGWTELAAAAELQNGDHVRLSRTGDASFQLDTGLDAVDMAEQDSADHPQGAQAARLGILHCCAADGHVTVRPGNSACLCCA